MDEMLDERGWITSFLEIQIPLEDETYKRIGNFTILWNLYETHACDKFANPAKIKAAVNILHEQSLVTKNLTQPFVDYFIDRYIDTDSKTPNQLFDGLKLPPALQNEVLKMLNQETNNQAEVLTALLYIVYRFRNNLFHGNKKVQTLDKQIQNFAKSNKLLTDILTIMRDNGLINQ